MPGWTIHLEAGKRVADKLKLSAKKRRQFLLGCILPDINNGYVSEVKTEIPHKETHYAFDQKSSLNFYEENKEKIDAKDPLFLGCLFHLYTDGYFNYDFYRTIKRSPIGENLTHEEKRKIKHHDFWIYDSNFNHHIGIEDKKEAEEMAEIANKINNIKITPTDIKNAETALKDNKISTKARGQEYIFYNQQRLDHLLDSAVEGFSKKYLGENHA